MKILLIGEFSGVHNNLKKGLLGLGHDVKLAADGDGFKKFAYDFRIAPHRGTFLGKIRNVLYILRNIKKFTGYDVVQFINPFSLPYYYSFFFITYIIFRYNKKSIYYACGTDPAFIASKDKFEYFPFDDPNDKDYPKYNLLSMAHYRLFIKLVDVIVPAMFTYAVGYWSSPKLTKPIPLPGSGRYEKQTKPIGYKLKVLFGISRIGFKGAEYILKAIDNVKQKYPDKFEFIIVEKLPFSEYNTLLKQCDILIDQCKSYDYAMNAIIGLESGLIVLSGAEEKAVTYLTTLECPVINITPDEDSISNTLVEFLQMSSASLTRIKQNNTHYVSNVHSLKKITQSFYDIYKIEGQ